MFRIAFLAFLSLIVSLAMTPMLINFIKKMNITDKPNARKVHQNPVPTLGGLAIFISFLIGVIIVHPVNQYHAAIIVGALMIVIIGVVDDLYDMSPKIKMAGQIAAAAVVVFWGGMQVSFINLPFGGTLEFGLFSSLITIIWIVGITNAINFIDGLDGLAAGVSSIALLTLAGMALVMQNVYVVSMALILFFATVGFLRYNFHPAKIFMGDTGAMFLGFMIAVLSLLGFKNVTLISFVIPIFILGVPIADTFIAIIRRKVNRQPISGADASHLHHRLVKMGFSHKQTVLFIYSLSAMFSLAAFLFSMTTTWGSVLIFFISIFAIQILIENLELINENYKPLTNLLKGLRHKD